MKVKIAAVVVLYNPDSDILNNINTYINQVDKLFVIDNSENFIPSLIDKIQLLNNVEYVYNHSNIGIAAALNIGAKKADAENFEYLLTMDQDSKASSEMVAELLKCFSIDSRIAIVSPFHKLIKNITAKQKNNICHQVLTTMTSGNLVKIKNLKEIGLYKEDFFIDYVDHEICLRMNKMGFKVYQNNETLLSHSLGELKQKFFLFKKVYPTHHSPLRLYYRTRNRLYVLNSYKKEFPLYCINDFVNFIKEFIKIILFESQRRKKLFMIYQGFIDFKKRNFGSIQPS